jgi:hypothetical protein
VTTGIAPPALPRSTFAERFAGEAEGMDEGHRSELERALVREIPAWRIVLVLR